MIYHSEGLNPALGSVRWAETAAAGSERVSPVAVRSIAGKELKITAPPVDVAEGLE